jgi:hypothetical protein
MQFDRNGVFVRQSQPVRRLKTVKKVITIDSRDRDTTKFVKVNGGASASDPGDYVEGLNRSDETATGANRAGFVDSWFAKINNPNITSGDTNKGYTIFYNDLVDQENITRYTPPIGRLDRFHVTFRYHPATIGTTPTTTANNAPITFGTAQNNTLTFEIEYLDNVFEDVSSFETQLDARGSEMNLYGNGRGY